MLITLEITSFRGMSPGASHYYGKLVFDYDQGIESIELKRPISKKEAREWNRHLRFSCFKAGAPTDRFDSREEIIIEALKIIKKQYPDAFLRRGSSGCASACGPLIYWPRKYSKLAERMNSLVSEWEGIGGYEGDAERAAKIDRKFQFLLEKIEKL